MTFSTRKSRHFSHSRRFWRWFGIGALLYLGWSAARGYFLLSQTRQIAAQNANFSRDYFVGPTHAPPLLYVVMGDSTAAGLGAGNEIQTLPGQLAQFIAAQNRRVRVVNLAQSGARVRDVIQNQLPALQKLRPDLVSLCVGANDATHFTKTADFERDFRWLLSALETTSARQILVSNTPDMFLAPALPLPFSLAVGRRARRFNSILRAQKRDSKLQIVDIFGRGKLDFRRDSTLYAADLFHPSTRGYRVWAALFIEKWRKSDS